MTSNGMQTGFLILILGASFAVAEPELAPGERHFELARAALVKGDSRKAERELRESLYENSQRGEAHFLLASLLAREGNLDEAIAGYEEAVRVEPRNPVAHYNLGTAMLLRGEPLLAAQSLEEALTLRPAHAATYDNLAKAYSLVGLPELAVACYREALRQDPANAVARRGLSVLTVAANGAADPAAPSTPMAGAKAKKKTDAVTTNAARQAAPQNDEVRAFRELVRDLPHVTVEWRGERVVLSGWTSGVVERKLLDRVLAGQTNVLDLTTDDVGDPHRILEVDAILFVVSGMDSQNAGHDFLRKVTVNASVADAAKAGFSWLYSAAISYDVNIANATRERLALLARPHLSTLSGSSATFIAGGDTVYKVSGTTSGDIKTYPFGTTLDVTPTLLRTPGTDGVPRVRLTVKAGRKTVLTLDSPEAQSTGSSVYANVAVGSEAVLDLNQTLILTGLSQRESTTSRSGIPGLKSIPIIKYLFSENITITRDLAIIILLTPRDPGYWGEQNQRALAEFVEKRQAYIKAAAGSAADMEHYKQQHPDWNKLVPNRFASHFFLAQTSEVYRQATATELPQEPMDFNLLGKPSKTKTLPLN